MSSPQELLSGTGVEKASGEIHTFNVFCADFRFPEAAPVILANLFPFAKNYWTSAFGASYGIENTMSRIQEAVDLAGVAVVNFFDHMDCAKYRSVYGQMDSEKERREHAATMHMTAQVIAENFPTVHQLGMYLLPEVTPKAINPLKVSRLTPEGLIVPVME